MTTAEVIQLLTVIPGLVALFFLWRRQPSEIKAVEATAAEVEAKAGGVYIENQQKMFAAYSEQGFNQLKLMSEVGALKAQVIHLEGENLHLKEDVKAAVNRAVAAEARATSAETALQQVNERTKDYPGRIAELETEVARLKQAAGEASERSLTDARTRETTAQTASEVQRASTTTTPDVPSN